MTVIALPSGPHCCDCLFCNISVCQSEVDDVSGIKVSVGDYLKRPVLYIYLIYKYYLSDQKQEFIINTALSSVTQE